MCSMRRDHQDKQGSASRTRQPRPAHPINPPRMYMQRRQQRIGMEYFHVHGRTPAISSSSAIVDENIRHRHFCAGYNLGNGFVVTYPYLARVADRRPFGPSSQGSSLAVPGHDASYRSIRPARDVRLIEPRSSPNHPRPRLGTASLSIRGHLPVPCIVGSAR